MSTGQQTQVPRGMREIYPYAAQYIAQELRDHGTDIAFGVQGGHIWNMVDAMSESGIKLITFGHEQNTVYAAEAYSKVVNKPGIVYVTAGPGVTNAISPTQQAYLSCSPLILLMGGGAPDRDGAYAIQIAYAEEVMGKNTKWTKRLTSPAMFKHWIAKAFLDSQIAPKGPIGLEFSSGALNTPIPPNAPPGAFGEHALYKEKWLGKDLGKPLTSGGDPELVEEAVKMLCEAKHPVIFAADGVHWSNGAQELVELAELAKVPVSTRRVTRGALPEDNQYFLSNRIVNQVLPDCDLVIAIGMKVQAFDQNYGSTWPRTIQINEAPEHIWTFLKTEIVIEATAKVVMRQMIDCIKANGYSQPPEREEWISRIQSLQKKRNADLQAKALKYKDNNPIHWGYLSKVVVDTCEELYGGMNRYVMDGFSISGFFPPFAKCRYSGQYLDSSEQAGVGHGVGMAIGAAFADLEGAGKAPIVTMMGDAGMANAGMEIETAVRHSLPIVYVVTNNNGWLTGMKYLYYGQNWETMGEQDHGLGQEFVQKQRYDELTKVFGGHGELVEAPGEIRPAFERCLRAAQSGKTAIMNVFMDPSMSNPVTHTSSYSYAWAHLPWDKIPRRGKAIRRNDVKSLPWDKAGVPPMAKPDPWDPFTDDDMIID